MGGKIVNEENEIVMPNFMVDTALKDCVNILSDTRAGKLFKLLFEYAENQDIDQSQLDSAVKLAFNAFKPGIDKGRKKYLSVINRNRENGKKGGAPKGNQNARKQPKTTQNNPTVKKTTQTTQNKQNKLNKSKLISKDINLHKEVSSAGLPEGQPAPKPEFSEVLRFYENHSGKYDAYFCDEFMLKMEADKFNWENWQEELIAYALKVGKLNG